MRADLPHNTGAQPEADVMASNAVPPVHESEPFVLLCVDDEASGLHLRKLILERHGYSVVTATTALDALCLFESREFDFVITDHLLGRATGTGMAAEMKRLRPNVPILLLSGTVDTPEGMQGVNASVSKADGPEQLLASVGELLGDHDEARSRTRPGPGIAEKVFAGESSMLQPLLAAIMQSSDDAIISNTLDGTVMTWNLAAEKMYGYSAKEIVGKPISLLEATDRSHEFHHILERLRQGEKIDRFETVHVTKARCSLPVSTTVSPVLDFHGGVVGASAIVRDISQLKLAEQALRNSERLAVAGRMAATLAHEITNPLECVTNTLYLLERRQTWDETASEFVKIAQSEIQKIRQITSLTLGLHRGADEQHSQTRIPDLINAVLALYGHKIQSVGIVVQTQFDSPGLVDGVPGELSQVFSNLMVNAADALQRTGGKLRIHVFDSHDWSSARKGVRITVADTGSGISSTARAHIFEPFYTTKGSHGTGIGLCVTHGIVTKYGGTIRLRSSTLPEHSGTAFSVFFPTTAATCETPMTDSKTKERRRQQRIRFDSPASVTVGQHSIAASTKDISDRGVFFFTDARFELGSEIDIVVLLPREAGLPLSGMVSCHGCVVRSDSSGGQYGVGAQIDRFAQAPQL